MRAAVAVFIGLAALAAVLAVLFRQAGPDDGPSPAPRPSSPPAVAVTVDAARPGRTVPRAFLGLATEWDSVAPYARARRALRPLLAPLRTHFGAPVTLRVGGDTGDQMWWNPSRRRPRPRTVLQDVTPATLRDVRQLAQALGGAPVTLGVNLALDDPQNAAALVRAAQRTLPRGALEAVEIGNEPDFFARPERRWTVPGHRHLRVRKFATYTAADYGRVTARYLRALTRDVPAPRPQLVAGGFAGPGWWPALGDLMRTWPVRPDAVAGHLYALPQCERPTPAPAWLMAARQSDGAAARLRPLAQLATHARVPLRVSELNSAACGGRPGVSDAPAAALWTADILFALLSEGAERANLQTWQHARYAPFDVADDGIVTRRPPLDGLEAFARAAPAGSRLLATRSADTATVRARATLDARTGTVRTLLLAPRAATVRLDAPCTRAWLATPRGRRTLTPRRALGGTCTLTLPAASLAVVTGPR